MLLEFLAINREFSRDRLISVVTLQWTLLRPVLFRTTLFERERERYGYNSEDAVAVLKICLIDNQYVEG